MKIQHSILAVAVVAALITGCAPKSKPVPGAPVLVAKAAVTNVPVEIDPQPVGHVMAITSVSVRPQLGGALSEIHFREGQDVHKGDLLFTIDPRPAQAALDAARAALARDQAQLTNAVIQFRRDQQLFEQKIESQDQYDTSKANMDAMAGTVQSDQAALTNALLNLDYTQIRAPMDGRTGALQTYAGNVVKSPDDVLVTINQVHPIYVAFAVPEQFLPQIRSAMGNGTVKASVTFDNMNVPLPRGELTFIDNRVDTTTGMIQLRATFPNDDNILWPGQFVKVLVTLSEQTNVVVVPSQAVQSGQNGEFVYVVKADQTAEEQPVTVGVTYQGMTVIKKGIQSGETVVTDGQLRLAPNVKVDVKAQ